LVDNKIVASGKDESELADGVVAYQEKNPSRRPLLVLVGSEDINPRAEVLPIEPRQDFTLITGQTSSLTFESIKHPREYEIDPLFKNASRFQDQSAFPPYDLYFFKRPVLSTTTEDREGKLRIVSFLCDTGSPFSFMRSDTLNELELAIATMDLWGEDVAFGRLWGRKQNWRRAKYHYSDVNILGCDVIHQHKLEVEFAANLVRL